MGAVLRSDSYGLASWRLASPFAADPFPNSLIIDTLQGQMINRWIGNHAQEWQLCYQMSTNGGSSTTFHTI